MLGDSPRKVSITVDRLGCNASSTLQVHANVLTAANTSMANTPSEPALVAPVMLEDVHVQVPKAYKQDSYLVSFTAPANSFTVLQAVCT